MPSRFFYTEDRPDAPLCDQNLLHARTVLRSALLRQEADKVVRAIDALIEAHVADYAYKHPQSYNMRD